MTRDFALPGTPHRYARDRAFDIRHYRIGVRLDVPNRAIDATCAIDAAPIATARRWLELDAVELDVRAVRAGGRALDFRNDGRTLRVDLGEPAAPGQPFCVDIDYAARPRRGLYFVGPDDGYPNKPAQVWTQGQDQDSRYWFPCFDQPHEKATSEVIATVPRGWFALSNGALVDRRSDGDGDTFHWRFDVPHSCYLITLAAGDFAEIDDECDGIAVRYYVQRGREDDCRRALSRTPEMVRLFSDRFGVRYPYASYSQVFVADFIFGGMENTTATTLTDTVLYDERAALDFDVDALVAHELAHQWFGDLLTCRDWGQGWLNEGFATYAEYVWREHAEGRDAAALELDEWAEQYFREDASRYRRPIATNVYDEPIDVFDHHLYEKGGRVLHMLRQVLGDDAFWASIAHYLRKHQTSAVETRDLARAIEDATGRVLDWFFDQWVLAGAGHPELKVAHRWDADARVAEVVVDQTHKTDDKTPLFRLPTRVRFRVDGRDIDFDVEVSERRHTFYFALAAEPAQAIFDPGRHLLAKIDEDKPLPAWIDQLAAATEGIDRIAAARRLGKLGGHQAEAALIDALDADPFWGVRAAAADALGALRTPTARDALIRAADATQHPKARRGVVRALGAFRRDEAAAEALARIVETGDPSYFVEAEACLALGKTRSPRAPAVLRAALARDSFRDVIRQHAYRGLAEANDDTALDLLLAGTDYGRDPHGRRAAIGAAAQLAAGRRDRDARRVRERAEELLADRDFRVQAAAVEAVATLADPASIPALRDLADRDLDGRLKRRAREIIRDIEEGRAAGERVDALASAVDELRADLAALRARVDRAGTRGKPAPRRRATGGKKTARPRRDA
ncbi:MAG: peptidase M1 [Deltaproteobacteria bacterium]|nr:MAG: peptidase M1 [Deltaproteobacteria bacterium]